MCEKCKENMSILWPAGGHQPGTSRPEMETQAMHRRVLCYAVDSYSNVSLVCALSAQSTFVLSVLVPATRLLGTCKVEFLICGPVPNT